MSARSSHVGLFAVAEERMGELDPLYDAWRRALDELEENSSVLRNQLYDRAVEVAAYQKTLIGRLHCSAHAALSSLFFKHLWKRRQRKVFTAAEVVHYRDAMVELERRVGGEDKLVRRPDPLDLRATPEHVRAVYRAYKDVFATAAERGLGFIAAVRTDGAEEALAAQIREREERRRAHEEKWRNRPPQPIEEVRAELAAVKRRMEQKYGPPRDGDD